MPTFRAKTSNLDLGFTLIELLISLIIIGFVISIGIPKLGRSLASQLRATTRRIVVLNREIHHSARMKDRTYRLVLDFGDKEKKTGPKIFVESGSSHELVADPSATPVPTKFSSDEKPPPAAFEPDPELLKKPLELPRGITFEDVEVQNQNKPTTEGRAYVYFFPQGLIQKAIIHITDGKKLHWSLVINPLTGNTEIIEEYIKLKDTDL